MTVYMYCLRPVSRHCLPCTNIQLSGPVVNNRNQYSGCVYKVPFVLWPVSVLLFIVLRGILSRDW